MTVQGRTVDSVLPMIFADQLHSISQIAHSTAELAVQGYITVPPASFNHKHNQYLYVNNRYVRPGQTGKTINSMFKRVMLKIEQDQQQKSSHQYPAFAIQITCPATTYDITSDPDKTHVEFTDWPAILAAVQAAVLSAWRAVIGDKMLSELSQNQQPHANAQAQCNSSAAANAICSAASKNTASARVLLEQPAAVPVSTAGTHKRKRVYLSPKQSSVEEDTDLSNLFSHSMQHHEKHATSQLQS